MVLGGGKKSEIRLKSEDSVPCYTVTKGRYPFGKHTGQGAVCMVCVRCM